MSANGTCSCGRALLPLNLLALGFLSLLFVIMQETRREQASLAPAPALLTQQLRSLDQQLAQTVAQGQQVIALRQHYYGLFTDLTELAKTDAGAAAIVAKYGIQYTPPETNAPAASTPAAK